MLGFRAFDKFAKTRLTSNAKFSYAFFFAAGLVAGFDFGFAADFVFVSAAAFFSDGGT